MFNNLLKVFHDGIIIMEEDKILYNNRKIIKIFNLESKIEEVNGEDDN